MHSNICTCRHCLCFYTVVVIINQCMIGVLVSTYTLFGSMPPSFSMSVGFWILLYTNYCGQFMAIASISVFRRGLDITWVNRMTEIGFVVTALFFFIGSVLYFLPVTADSMMAFCKIYFKFYKDIPPFLDRIQTRLKCCGIYNYLDYGKELAKTNYGDAGFYVYRQAEPNDDFFHQLTSSLKFNRTIGRRTNGLDVPQSCCPYERAMDPTQENCGMQVEYSSATEGSDLWRKQEASANEKVNDPKMGCYEKFQRIRDAGYQFQLTFLLGTIQYMSLLQAILYLCLLWFHRVALKNIRQLAYWLPELTRLHGNRESVHEHARLQAEADAVQESHEKRRRASRASLKSYRSSIASEIAELERAKSFHDTAILQPKKEKKVKNEKTRKK